MMTRIFIAIGAVIVLAAVNLSIFSKEQIKRDGEVVAQLFTRMQAPRSSRQRFQERCDRLPVGRFIHPADEFHNIGQRIFAYFPGNFRPHFQKDQDRLGTASHLAEKSRVFDVSRHPPGG